jgi:hypothetical protein
METKLEQLKPGDKFKIGDSPYLFVFTGKCNLIGHYQGVTQVDESVDIYLPGVTIVYRVVNE